MIQKRIFSKENYNALIKNSIGSELFRNYMVDGKDVVGDGNNACAFYVSSILMLAGYLPRVCFTVVDGIEWQIKELPEIFIEIDPNDIEIGDILIWNTSPQSNNHPHSGFCWEMNHAISNSSKEKSIQIHTRDYDGDRKVARAYRILF